MTGPDAFPSEWQMPPQQLSLPPDEVHVWAAPLAQSPLVVSAMLQRLSPDERSRAERFHFPRDRDRHVMAHGVLREILGQYLHLTPAGVPIRSLPQGKLVLAPEVSGAQLEFNLSHSHELVLIAVGSGRRLGVDVEHIRADLNGKEIAERFFSPGEIAALRALPERLQSDAFFACWTRKEAYSKAHGEGLRMPLTQFAVVVTPGEPAALLHDEADPHAASRWSLRSLDVGPAYAASLAVEGQDWYLRQWLWQNCLSPR